MGGDDITNYNHENKAHRASQRGKKAKNKLQNELKKEAAGSTGGDGEDGGVPEGDGTKSKTNRHENAQRNVKAFSMFSAVRAGKEARRRLDIATKKHNVPVADRTVTEPPPVVIAVVGPPKVGKSTLIRSLVKHYTKQNVHDPQGPILAKYVTCPA